MPSLKICPPIAFLYPSSIDWATPCNSQSPLFFIHQTVHPKASFFQARKTRPVKQILIASLFTTLKATGEQESITNFATFWTRATIDDLRKKPKTTLQKIIFYEAHVPVIFMPLDIAQNMVTPSISCSNILPD